MCKISKFSKNGKPDDASFIPKCPFNDFKECLTDECAAYVADYKNIGADSEGNSWSVRYGHCGLIDNTKIVWD